MSFSMTFTALPEHIDELGHVNNAVWVQWIQEVAVTHWNATARPEDRDKYVWVILRHEIDYRGNLLPGETCVARTWVPDPPRGARFDRHVAFERDGKTLVSAISTWAMVDRATGRVQRVSKEVAAPFLA